MKSQGHGWKAIDLAGQWEHARDDGDTGERDGASCAPLPQSIRLPGSLQEAGFGDPPSIDSNWIGSIQDDSWFTDDRYAPYREPGRVKLPFWLTPIGHYTGAAWYARDVDIPKEWEGRTAELELERPHWETTLFWDGERTGSCDALGVPHRYRIADLRPGTHRLAVRVRNTMIHPVGRNAHSMSDHTQTPWNGIVGRLVLRLLPAIRIESCRTTADVAARSVTLDVALGWDEAPMGESPLELTVTGPAGAQSVRVRPTEDGSGAPGATASSAVGMLCELGPDAALWDEFSPVLHRLHLALSAGGHTVDERDLDVGLREVTTGGTRILLNGTSVFLRGTLECAVFPLTGYPATDEASWQRIFSRVKEYGLNHVRFHSWCPPRAAFQAADRLGVYLQVECGAWPNGDSSIGDGRSVDEWLYREAERIIDEYGNHPSFLLMAHGNEPAGPGNGAAYLEGWLGHMKAYDNRRLYTGAAGWPQIPANDYHNVPQPRIQAWGAGLSSRVNALPPATTADYREFITAAGAPTVSHEIGQWCAFPDLAEAQRYTGVLRAGNFDIFGDFLRQNNLGKKAAAFLQSSGKLQVELYKEEIESALRTRGMGGFQLLGLSDFPGQGTATVGMLNAFWDPKPYTDAAYVRQFCGPVVPLARIPKRVLLAGNTIAVQILLANYGPADLESANIRWSFTQIDQSRAGSREVASGAMVATAPRGELTEVGSITFSAPDVAGPAVTLLTVHVEADGTEWTNSWRLWVYPLPAVDAGTPRGSAGAVFVGSGLGRALLDRVQEGASAIVSVPQEQIPPNDVIAGFSPVFWNTLWTKGQAPHTLGIHCDPNHPALAGFPTASHSDWQWWELVHDALPFVLDGCSPDMDPIVAMIDTWFRSHRLGLVVEARYGAGRLILTSVDLDRDPTTYPVTAALRASLAAYAAGPHFAPAATISMDQIESLARVRDLP